MLQIAHEFTTSDVAKALGVSPSFVYAVLKGEKSIPAAWPERIADAFALPRDDAVFLDNARDATPCTLSLTAKTPLQAEVANAFVRAFPDLSPADLERIKSLLSRPPSTTDAAGREKGDRSDAAA